MSFGALHAALRAATQDHHRALDSHPILAALLAPDLDLGRYGQALSALYALHAGLTPGLAAQQAEHPELLEGRLDKLSRLAADLADCRLALPAPATGAPVIDRLETLIGVLYTLEGASLGGHHIARHLGSRTDTSFPLRHFNGYGEHTMARWRQFWEIIDRHQASLDTAIVITAAQATFDYFRGHLERS
jgi:heme oxygenase